MQASTYEVVSAVPISPVTDGLRIRRMCARSACSAVRKAAMALVLACRSAIRSCIRSGAESALAAQWSAVRPALTDRTRSQLQTAPASVRGRGRLGLQLAALHPA